MSKKRRWTNDQLTEAVSSLKSYRAVLFELGLRPTGGNYEQLRKYIKELSLDTSHFSGMGWNKGLKFNPNPPQPIEKLLIIDGHSQSNTLKRRLYTEGLKKPKCELCGWCSVSTDGRIPVELDHINGNHNDNRLENLRILCPNCHSLQLTHRGKNKGMYDASKE